MGEGGERRWMHYVSVGRDVPPKGVQLLESDWEGVYSIVQILGRG